MTKPTNLFTRLWKYCVSLLDDDLKYVEYVQQLEYLVFLKMAEEYKTSSDDRPSIVPEVFSWSTLVSKNGQELVDHYERTIEALRKEEGLPGTVFKTAQNRIKDPAKLKHWIDLIDEGQWASKTFETNAQLGDESVRKG